MYPEEWDQNRLTGRLPRQTILELQKDSIQKAVKLEVKESARNCWGAGGKLKFGLRIVITRAVLGNLEDTKPNKRVTQKNRPSFLN